MLTLEEIAKQLDVCKETIRRWQRHGLIRAVPFTDSNQCLYELPIDPPIKSKGIPMTARRPIVKDVDAHPREVQYEA